jgi:hypothetical protein
MTDATVTAFPSPATGETPRPKSKDVTGHYARGAPGRNARCRLSRQLVLRQHKSKSLAKS